MVPSKTHAILLSGFSSTKHVIRVGLTFKVRKVLEQPGLTVIQRCWVEHL